MPAGGLGAAIAFAGAAAKNLSIALQPACRGKGPAPRPARGRPRRAVERQDVRHVPQRRGAVGSGASIAVHRRPSHRRDSLRASSSRCADQGSYSVFRPGGGQFRSGRGSAARGAPLCSSRARMVQSLRRSCARQCRAFLGGRCGSGPRQRPAAEGTFAVTKTSGTGARFIALTRRMRGLSGRDCARPRIHGRGGVLGAGGRRRVAPRSVARTQSEVAGRARTNPDQMWTGVKGNRGS